MDYRRGTEVFEPALLRNDAQWHYVLPRVISRDSTITV